MLLVLFVALHLAVLGSITHSPTCLAVILIASRQPLATAMRKEKGEGGGRGEQEEEERNEMDDKVTKEEENVEEMMRIWQGRTKRGDSGEDGIPEEEEEVEYETIEKGEDETYGGGGRGEGARYRRR
eukprot:752982-Hanusia_phi.AAC.1